MLTITIDEADLEPLVGMPLTDSRRPSWADYSKKYLAVGEGEG
jgi:hypothetical protein